MRMTIVTTALAISVFVIATTAYASTPAAMEFSAPFSNDEPVIRWGTVNGVDHYELTGTFLAVRINRDDPFCSRPQATDRRTIDVDETLGPDVTEFALPLPELPQEDGWFFANSNVWIRAVDAEGIDLATGGAVGIAETRAICATETPGPVLPDTGMGAGGHRLPVALMLAGALAALGFALLATVRMRQSPFD